MNATTATRSFASHAERGPCCRGTDRAHLRIRSGIATIAAIVFVSLAQTVSAEPQLTRPPRQPVKQVEGVAAVVCDTSIAARIGRDVLKDGGSAVDAAVAVAFALTATWPEAGNIGGGGFMIVAPPGDKDVICVDYRETAPAAATRETFLKWTDTRHAIAAGVPGTIHGLAHAHKRYGRLPWSRLVEPTIKLARDGFEVDQYLAYSLNTVLRDERIRTLDRYAEFRRVYAHPETYLWSAGQTLTLTDLAATLTQIAEDRGDSFYHGSLAETIGEDVTAQGGLITREDLAAYSSLIRPAVHETIRGYTVYGAPPVSSGGLSVLMQLKALDSLGLTNETNHPWTTANVHLMAEVMRRVYRDRAAYLGDPTFVAIPPDLLSNAHTAELIATIQPDTATPSENVADGIPIVQPANESKETTHFSIVDADGMAVSNTYTLEGTYGSRIVVRGTGILLNNEMGDFNWVPGRTTTTGYIGTEPNTVAPGKRMLSSQSPTIVKRDGRVAYILGTPGGRTIINSVVEVLAQTIFFGRTLAEAVEAPRFHHQWFPDVIRFETTDDPHIKTIAAELRKMGHQVELQSNVRQGSLHAIHVDPATGRVTGVADGRRSIGCEVVD